MTDRAQLKYVRTDAGFSTCPSLMGQKQHVLLAAATSFTPISAGFIEWDFDGLPLCMGRSESLNLNSMACDTAALRKAWGMKAASPAVVMSASQIAAAQGFPPAPPLVLNPSLQAEAQAVGAVGDAESLEAGEPA